MGDVDSQNGRGGLLVTRDEILSMPAGAEMDHEIAEHVFGWCGHPVGCGCKVPPYSTSDAAALEVLKVFKAYEWESLYNPAWTNERTGRSEPDYFQMRIDLRPPAVPIFEAVVGTGDTLALAICRAALLAKLDT